MIFGDDGMDEDGGEFGDRPFDEGQDVPLDLLACFDEILVTSPEAEAALKRGGEA